MVSKQVQALSIGFGAVLDFGIFVAIFYGLSQTPWFDVAIGSFLNQFGTAFILALVAMQAIDVALQQVGR
ncbi:MAG: hypothetical protein ABEK12_00085 [Candidatus Nanohaloarchaea archaeon]